MASILPLGLALYFSVGCSGGKLASSAWRKPNITTSLTDRVRIADAGVQKAISMLSPDAQFDGQSLAYAAQLYSQMAELDIVSNQTQYADTLRNNFLNAPHRQTNFSDTLAYGHAACRAYVAYNDSVFYDYAVQSWWFGRTYTLSSQEIAAGTTSVKNFTLSKECQDITMAGGTFWVSVLPSSPGARMMDSSSAQSTDANEPTIASLGTGTFFVLSALLAELTSDPTEKNLYLQAAAASANFTQAHLLNSQGLVQDTISALSNASCASNSIHESYDAGLAIEGLSILYSVTGDPATQSLLNSIVVATIPNTAWQHSNGVLTNGDLYLLRGLTSLYARQSIPDLQDDIGQYIAVQFNAVIDLTTANGTNIYGNAWAGPPSSAFSPVNQSNALSALLGAINLRNTSDVSGSPSPEPSSTPTNSPLASPHKSNDAIIIGIVLAVVALMGVAISIWAIRRRRSRSASMRISPVSFSMWDSLRQISGEHTRDAPDQPPPTVGSKSAPGLRPAAAAAAPMVRVGAQDTAQLPPPPNLPTDELVRMLNERLQNRNWDEEEAPPEYPV
ncbi:Glycoside hydrolase family 76 protein [Mycena sanguinolenta]|uniref:Glycoside hydrolase family 76 protein n=1 Tax=Mycena sanguinolenta TaxID=230812 RepID=A0A8H7CQD4_9AGAR|nr:Glycoside hydrolase family 76 protein [Mycena sanguinolenta]